jgi:lipopolysaccharide transport system ATP-binding protein
MDYEVLKPGYKLMPSIELWNQEGVCLIDSLEYDPVWRGRVRPAGRYRSTAWIPGNYLAEGTMFVSVALETVDPKIMQFYEKSGRGVLCRRQYVRATRHALTLPERSEAW